MKLSFTKALLKSIKYVLAFKLRIVRKIYFDVVLKRFKNDIKKPDILFSNYLIGWRKYTHQNGEIYDYDLFLGDVIEKANEEGIKTFGLDMGSGELLRPYKDTKNKFSQSKDWACFEQFITFKNIRYSLSLSLKKTFGKKIDAKYEKYLEIDNSNYYQDFFNLLTCENILNQIQPKAVFLSCEYGPEHKIFTYACKINKIPVLALQHGIIFPTHPGYFFEKGDKREAILPDLTCVYGNYYFEMLTKNSIYKPDRVTVTGSPRYDVLFQAGKIYSKKDFIKKYDIDPKNKIILWPTQCSDRSGNNIENIKNFDAVFSTMKNIKDSTLVIKQHPDEGKEYTNLIQKYLKKYDLDAVIVPKLSDTYEILFISDLIVAKSSTTIVEAVILNKPVIVLNLGDKPDIAEYVDEKVALSVTKKENLEPTIRKLLIDDSELSKNRKKYIEKYLYKIDGQSSKRVVGLIGGFIK